MIADYVLSLLAAAAFGLLFFFPLQRAISRRLNGGREDFQRRLTDIARASSTLQERLPPSVFLKPIGDEAALALTWTSAMAALMQGTSALLFLALQWMRDRWKRIPRTLRIFGGLLLTAAWSMGMMQMVFFVTREGSMSRALPRIAAEALHFEDAFQSTVSVTLIWAVLASAIGLLMLCAFVAVLGVALFAAAGAGMPSLNAALFFRISVEAVPVGSHRLVLVNVSSQPPLDSARVPAGRLSHSALYDSPDAIRAVLDALANFETPPVTVIAPTA